MEFPLPPKKLPTRLEPDGASVQRGSLPKKLLARLEPLPYSKVTAFIDPFAVFADSKRQGEAPERGIPPLPGGCCPNALNKPNVAAFPLLPEGVPPAPESGGTGTAFFAFGSVIICGCFIFTVSPYCGGETATYSDRAFSYCFYIAIFSGETRTGRRRPFLSLTPKGCF